MARVLRMIEFGSCKHHHDEHCPGQQRKQHVSRRNSFTNINISNISHSELTHTAQRTTVGLTRERRSDYIATVGLGPIYLATIWPILH